MARRASSSRAGFLGFLGPDFVSRVLIPAAIVLFWGGMVTHLVTRKIVPNYLRAQHTLVDPDILLAQWQPIREWAWIQYHDARVGGTGLVIDKWFDDPVANMRWMGYQLKQNTHVDVTLPGSSTIPVTARIQIHFTPEFHVQEFAATVTGEGIGLECQGFVQAGRVYYRFSEGAGAAEEGRSEAMTYGYLEVGTRPLDLSEAVKRLLARHGSLRVGDRYLVRVFNPLGDLAAQDAQVVVAGEETLTIDHQAIPVLRLETTVNGLPPARKSWVDTSGVTQRRELMFGYMTERGGANAIMQEYPTLDKNLTMPVMDRRDFMRRAELAGPGEPDGAQTLGLLGAFLRTL